MSDKYASDLANEFKDLINELTENVDACRSLVAELALLIATDKLSLEDGKIYKEYIDNVVNLGVFTKSILASGEFVGIAKKAIDSARTRLHLEFLKRKYEDDLKHFEDFNIPKKTPKTTIKKAQIIHRHLRDKIIEMSTVDGKANPEITKLIAKIDEEEKKLCEAEMDSDGQPMLLLSRKLVQKAAENGIEFDTSDMDDFANEVLNEIGDELRSA